MTEDDLVLEVRAAREAYCERFGYDLKAIVRDLRAKQRTGGRQVVRLEPRRPVATNVSPTESADAPNGPGLDLALPNQPNKYK